MKFAAEPRRSNQGHGLAAGASRLFGMPAAIRDRLRIMSLPLRTVSVVTLACCLMLGFVGWREWVARSEQLRETAASLMNLASSLTDHADDTIEIADTALVGLVERVETDGVSPASLARLERVLALRLSALPRVHDFVVFDEHGNWLATTMPSKGGNNADREYFRHHMDNPDRASFVGPLIHSRSNGNWYISVSRRTEHADGSFAGVVLALIEVSYFADHYATFHLDRDSSIALFSTSGTLLVRYPFDQRDIGRDLAHAQVFAELRKAPAGHYETVAIIDGIKRYAGYRRSDRFPFVVGASMSAEQALGAWRTDARLHFAGAVLLAAVVWLLGLHLARQMWRRQRAERSVRESEASYRLLADSTTDVIICLDLKFRRTYVSPSCRAMFGFGLEEMLARSPAEDIHPDDRMLTLERVRRLTSGEAEFERTTHRLRHKHGHYVWVEINLSLVRDGATGQPASLTCSVRDVTERQAQSDALGAANAELERLARNLARARDGAVQASRAKSRFLAGMSHELRTPLHGILGYAQLLHVESGLSPVQRARVDAMLGAGKHLLQMINGVLDLSQIEAERVTLQPAATDVRTLAANCLDLVRPTAEAKALALSLAIAPDVPRTITADPTRLRQILLNLLGNAVKFTARGSVRLLARIVAEGAGPPGRRVPSLRFEVRDTGPGIPPNRQHRLFQDFERLDVDATSASEGAGLGLSLSARLAGLMGGLLGQEDNPDGGSVFWVELPLAAASTSALVLEGEPHRAAASALHILVVDDAPMNRDIAGAFLRKAGHSVACASSGAEAVAAVDASEFDIVLMDLRMPEMDGLEATRRIRAMAGRRAQVPIIALTAQVFAEQVAECNKAGMDGHLAKPFTPEALLAAVLRATGSRHSTPSVAAGEQTPVGRAFRSSASANAALAGVEPD